MDAYNWPAAWMFIFNTLDRDDEPVATSFTTQSRHNSSWSTISCVFSFILSFAEPTEFTLCCACRSRSVFVSHMCLGVEFSLLRKQNDWWNVKRVDNSLLYYIHSHATFQVRVYCCCCRPLKRHFHTECVATITENCLPSHTHTRSRAYRAYSWSGITSFVFEYVRGQSLRSLSHTSNALCSFKQF